MTLASRLSTYETLGYLEGKEGKTLICANLALVQVQAVCDMVANRQYDWGMMSRVHGRLLFLTRCQIVKL
jgi:hypothetical protein